MTRVAIYSRVSTDKQNEASTEHHNDYLVDFFECQNAKTKRQN